LPDALAAQVELAAELLQRARGAPVDAVADPEDLLLPRVERVEQPVDPLADRLLPGRRAGAGRAGVAHELADRILLAVGERVVERHGAARELHERPDGGGREPRLLGGRFEAGRVAGL